MYDKSIDFVLFKKKQLFYHTNGALINQPEI